MAELIVWTEQAKADVRGIEQPIALQILKTLARYAHAEANSRARHRPYCPAATVIDARLPAASQLYDTDVPSLHVTCVRRFNPS